MPAGGGPPSTRCRSEPPGAKLTNLATLARPASSASRSSFSRAYTAQDAADRAESRARRGAYCELALRLLVGQQAGVDLAQRDRQRLLLRLGVDQRADVLQQALAQLAVVGVDLARPLGGVDDERVLRAGALEQLVDGRVGDALGDRDGAGQLAPTSWTWGQGALSRLPTPRPHARPSR